MPTKKYAVTITASLDSQKTVEGSREVNSALSTMEKNALEKVRQIRATFNTLPASVRTAMEQGSQAFNKAEQQKVTYAARTNREVQRLAQNNTKDQEHQYQTNVKAFERAENEKVKAAERTVGTLNRLASSVKSFVGAARGQGVGSGEGGFLPGLANISEIVQGIPQIGALAGAIVRPLTNAAEEGVKFNAFLETSKIGFTTLLGSEQAAMKHLEELEAFAAKTPFQFKELVEDSQRMQAFGFESKRVIPILTAVGDALSATGEISKDALDGVLRQMGQMRSAGRVTAQDMNAITDHGIPAWDLLAKAIGKTVAETRKLAETGKLNGTAAVEAIAAQMEARYGGQMDKVSNTLTGRLSNLEDIRDRAQGLATQSLTSDISKSIDAALKQGDLTTSVAMGINTALTPVSGLIRASVTTVLGGGITAGLTDAFSAAKNTLPASVLDMATGGVINPFKWALGINSPSKVFIGYGEMTAIGYADGLKDGTKQYVQPAIDDLKKRIEDLLKDPNMQAFLEVIKRSEVGKDRQPYTRLFGRLGHLPSLEGVDPMAGGRDPWPGTRVMSPTLGRMVTTHTLGPYQAEPGTYREFARQTGVRDVLPHSQDMFAAWDILTKHPQALEKIQGGDALGAMNSLKKEWESFAVNSAATKQTLVELFDKARVGGITLGGSEVSSSNPLPVNIVSFAQGSAAANAAMERLVGQGVRSQDLVGGAQYLFQQHSSTARIIEGGSVDAGAIKAQFEPLEANLNGFSAVLAQTAHSGFPEMADAAKAAFSDADKAAGAWADRVIQKGDEAAKQIAQTNKTIAASFGNAFEQAFSGKGLRGAWSTLRSDFKSMLLEMGKDAVESQVFKFLSGLTGKKDSASSSSGGNLLSTIFGGVKGLFGKRSATSTPTFEGGDIPLPTGGSASSVAASLLGSMSPRVGGAFGFGMPSGKVLQSLIEASDTHNAISIPPSLTEPLIKNLGNVPLGSQGTFGNAASSAASAGLFSGFSGPALAGNLATIAPLAGLFGGISLGGSSRVGQVLGGVGGGIIGGAVGLSALAYATGGASLAGGGLIAGASTLLTNPFTLAAGVGLLVGALILGKNAARRKDEQTRDQLMRDSFAEIDKIVAAVKAGQLDGTGALAQAAQIQSQYLQAANALKDSKTRRIAVSDAYRIQTRIDQSLKPAIAAAADRAKFTSGFIPTFATGGSFDIARYRHLRFADGSAFQMFPKGLLDGPGTSRSDSITALVSKREYILDGETTENIGVERLDRIRARKGKGFADGGAFSGETSSPSSPTSRPIVINVVNRFDAVQQAVRTEIQTEYAGEIILGHVENNIDKEGRYGVLGSIELGLNKR